MPKRKFTREFKESAVGLVRQQGYTVPQAAQSLGVDPSSIRYWLARLDGQLESPAAGGEAALRSENQRLRKQNAQLLMEREILKKAAVFFAKEQP